MHLYRIARTEWIQDLSGRGAELAGGRWNAKGIPAVYTSESVALCICEILVHTDKDLPPFDMSLLALEIPDSLLSREYIDFDWKENPLVIGTRWLKKTEAPALLVPSRVAPHSYNCILNPQHPDFNQIRILQTEPFSFDDRFIPAT